jgi:hypothetical protein
MGLQCLGSLVRSVPGVSLVVHEDGTLTDEDVEKLKGAFPLQQLVRRRDADEAMREALDRYPACSRMRSENTLMLKLFDVALMSSDVDIRYCDTDVLFFRRVAGLFERASGTPASAGAGCNAPAWARELGSLHVPPRPV